MGLIGKIELVSDVISLSQGQIPVGSLITRAAPIFFHRKKGLSKAKMKKLLMRRRRRFVDTVIMAHKRIHDKNRASVIERTKTKIISRTKDSSGKPISHASRAPQPSKGNNKWKAKAPQQGENRAKIKGLVSSDRQKSRSKWASKVESGGQREL